MQCDFIKKLFLAYFISCFNSDQRSERKVLRANWRLIACQHYETTSITPHFLVEWIFVFTFSLTCLSVQPLWSVAEVPQFVTCESNWVLLATYILTLRGLPRNIQAFPPPCLFINHIWPSTVKNSFFDGIVCSWETVHLTISGLFWAVKVKRTEKIVFPVWIFGCRGPAATHHRQHLFQLLLHGGSDHNYANWNPNEVENTQEGLWKTLDNIALRFIFMLTTRLNQ